MFTLNQPQRYDWIVYTPTLVLDRIHGVISSAISLLRKSE